MIKLCLPGALAGSFRRTRPKALRALAAEPMARDCILRKSRCRTLRRQFSDPIALPRECPLHRTSLCISDPVPIIMKMTPRLAACEACRKAKLSCDHKRPVCSRCAANNNAAICTYRPTPFKRRRLESPADAPQSTIRQCPAQSTASFRHGSNPYPNPGFLGSSSHVAIFNHIFPEDGHGSDTYRASEQEKRSIDPQSDGDYLQVMQAADILRQLLNSFPLSAMKDLVIFWLERGANLALAEPFTRPFTENINRLFATFHDEQNWSLAYARRLLQNSCRPLEFDDSSDITSFSAQFENQNFRLESLGIFLSAVTRATIDIPYFPLLYTTEKDQLALRKLSTKLSDAALEIALSLDCLNDLQLVLQYENFIVHSHVDGDQSYNSWCRLGNVISSMFALGYHEDAEKAKPRMPQFLTELRKTACATVYSADKNVAVFLGRPPRMSKRFCHFQVPLTPTFSDQPHSASSAQSNVSQWNLDTSFSYRAELRWSALCASLKEDILELLRDKHSVAHIRRASVVEKEAYAQWQALPTHFRLNCSLKECTRNPFELDFLAGLRLNHLHVLFLLRLLRLDTLAEPDLPILEISEEILNLVVECILLRDRLVNSGTGLVWKVAHYGLPSAGIILLSMLKQNMNIPNEAKPSRSKTLLNLGIFVAQIQAGSIVRSGDPNYALISKATHTIDRFLDSVHREGIQAPAGVTSRVEANDDWASLFGQDLCDFEADFWQNLAEHPSLLAQDPVLSTLP